MATSRDCCQICPGSSGSGSRTGMSGFSGGSGGSWIGNGSGSAGILKLYGLRGSSRGGCMLVRCPKAAERKPLFGPKSYHPPGYRAAQAKSNFALASCGESDISQAGHRNSNENVWPELKRAPQKRLCCSILWHDEICETDEASLEKTRTTPSYLAIPLIAEQ